MVSAPKRPIICSIEWLMPSQTSIPSARKVVGKAPSHEDGLWQHWWTSLALASTRTSTAPMGAQTWLCRAVGWPICYGLAEYLGLGWNHSDAWQPLESWGCMPVGKWLPHTSMCIIYTYIYIYIYIYTYIYMWSHPPETTLQALKHLQLSASWRIVVFICTRIYIYIQTNK